MTTTISPSTREFLRFLVPMKLVVACLAAAALTGTTPFVKTAGASMLGDTVIYLDEFSSESTNLNGDVPAPNNGLTPHTDTNSQTWNADNSWTTNGSVLNVLDDISEHAWLDFNPQPGLKYWLTADVNPFDASDDWLGIGFGNDGDGSGESAGTGRVLSNFGPWMMLRGQDGDGSPVTQNIDGSAFSVDATSIAEYDVDTNGDNATAEHELHIELDTTGANWVATFFVDDNQVGQHTYTTNPTISTVDVLTAGQGGPVDNFRLSVIPEPASLILLGIGGLIGLCLFRPRGQ